MISLWVYRNSKCLVSCWRFVTWQSCDVTTQQVFDLDMTRPVMGYLNIRYSLWHRRKVTLPWGKAKLSQPARQLSFAFSEAKLLFFCVKDCSNLTLEIGWLEPQSLMSHIPLYCRSLCTCLQSQDCCTMKTNLNMLKSQNRTLRQNGWLKSMGYHTDGRWFKSHETGWSNVVKLDYISKSFWC